MSITGTSEVARSGWPLSEPASGLGVMRLAREGGGVPPAGPIPYSGGAPGPSRMEGTPGSGPALPANPAITVADLLGPPNFPALSNPEHDPIAAPPFQPRPNTANLP